ncbi:MAG: nuclear transport factor 2 family protein [Saprospiraceae bacterium]
MKKILLTSLILSMLSINGFSQSKAESTVANAVETLRQAMVDANKTVLEAITAVELSYGHSSGKVENRAEFIEALTSGKSDFVSIQLHDQTIKIVDKKTAIVRHRLSGETNDNGKQGTVNLNILLIWQQQKGAWKLLARQAARVM